MAKSLIEELPRIVNEGRKEAVLILERLSNGTQIGLQTSEFLMPSIWQEAMRDYLAD